MNDSPRDGRRGGGDVSMPGDGEREDRETETKGQQGLLSQHF